jgi:hypothetical protein
MTLRADHVAGASFVGLGVLVIALSGDLPVGTLSLPGSGFMPHILAGFSMLFGLALMLRASAESKPFSALDWSDGPHAAMVVVITAAGIAVFEQLGFLITMILMMFALLVVIERRNMVYAAVFSISIVVITYLTFEYVLKTPLVAGPFGF